MEGLGLDSVSRDIQSIASSLSVLPTLATDDMAGLARANISIICRHVLKLRDVFPGVSDHFTRARRSDSLFHIRGKSHPSAHDVALSEGSWLIDYLSYGLSPQKGDARSFDMNLVTEKWPLAKAAILERLDESWRDEFRDIPSYLHDERARLSLNASGTTTETAPQNDDDDTAGYEQRAIAYFLAEVRKRPADEITKAEMVVKFHCAKSTLSKKRAPQLHAVMEGHRSQPAAGTVRRGSKDADGNIEAYGDEVDFDAID